MTHEAGRRNKTVALRSRPQRENDVGYDEVSRGSLVPSAPLRRFEYDATGFRDADQFLGRVLER